MEDLLDGCGIAAGGIEFSTVAGAVQCRVTFTSQEGALKALARDGMELGESRIRVALPNGAKVCSVNASFLSRSTILIHGPVVPPMMMQSTIMCC